MRTLIPAFFISLLLFQAACKSKDKEAPKSENSIDAARNFIRAALDGKFSEAGTYMLQDSLNLNFLEVAERSYKNADQSVKDGYRGASIRFYDPVPTNSDSVAIVVYDNSFKNDKDTLKLVRINNNWLVDLKFLYLHDEETTPPPPLKTDTLK